LWRAVGREGEGRADAAAAGHHRRAHQPARHPQCAALAHAGLPKPGGIESGDVALAVNDLAGLMPLAPRTQR